jgi:hypothetical protein
MGKNKAYYKAYVVILYKDLQYAKMLSQNVVEKYINNYNNNFN